MPVRIKGDFIKEGNSFGYYNKYFLCNSVGSKVIVKSNDEVCIKTDILGIDKIYYLISEDELVISNRFTDFRNVGIDEDLWSLQIAKGSIPYPFLSPSIPSNQQQSIANSP